MPARSFLFTTTGVESGQLVPIFAVAQRLVSRGHRVRLLLGPTLTGPPQQSIIARAEAAGCETSTVRLSRRDSTNLPPLRHAFFGWTPEKIGMPVQAIHRLYSITPQFAVRVADELKVKPAEAVVGDNFYPGAFVAAEAAGVPAVSLMHNPYHSIRPGLIPRGAGHRPPRGPIDRLRHAVQMTMHRRVATGNALPGLNAARSQMGLAPVRSLAEQDDRLARVLVLSSPAFDFHPGPLPTNVRIVGWPIAAAQADASWNAPWPEDDERPLVLLSPSTTTQAQEQLPFFNRALAAMSDIDARGLLTAGPNADPATFKSPGNVIVEPYVPHAAVMPRAAMIVSHCGHGTVMTALSHGVPVLCVPYGRDQYDVAARVVWAGAGIEISKNASTDQIGSAIKAMLATPRFKESASRMARAMSAEDGAETAANEIEAVLDRS